MRLQEETNGALNIQSLEKECDCVDNLLMDKQDPTICSGRRLCPRSLGISFILSIAMIAKHLLLSSEHEEEDSPCQMQSTTM
jgi:hypothetical protein